MDREAINNIDFSEVIALIPARGGSKSVPKKNIRLFEGYPLIAYTIAAARLSKKITRVIVSTDSEEIAAISKQYGAEVPFLRPAQFARDESPDIDFVKHAIGWLNENEMRIPEYIAHLRPTTPIRDFRVMEDAIQTIMKDPKATSLRSGSLCIHPPYKWFVKMNRYLMPLMGGLTCDEANLPRQDFPEVYIPNGYVDILKSDFVIQSGLMHGDCMIGFQTEEVLDIDTEKDLEKTDFPPTYKEIIKELQAYLKML